MNTKVVRQLLLNAFTLLGQRVPVVDRRDVERIARREFPLETSNVISMLDQALGERNHRVQVAVLKLANGDLSSLRQYITIAQQDWRDVLAYAEYPSQMKQDTSKSSYFARLRINARDRSQYKEWFDRPSLR